MLKINKELLQLFGLGDALDDSILLRYERQLITAYQKARKSIVGQISAMYEKYGDDVTYDEMASFNRLTNLEQEINQQLNGLGVSSKSSISNSIKSSYQTSYQYSGFAMERALQVKMGFGLLSEKQVQAVLLNPLKHIKWTDSEKANIISAQLDIRNKIADGLIQGKGFSTTASEVKDSLDISFNRAMRIIQTETHRVQTAGRLAGMDQGQKAIDELGMESERMWLPTRDARTRPNHGAMDGKPAKIQEDGTTKFRFTTAQGNTILVSGPGLTGTTDDINCRCTVFIQFEEFPINVRKDNETKKIIPQTSYNDWYKKKYGKAPNVPKTKGLPKVAFTPVKTLSEAESYAKKFAKGVDYKGIPLDQANRINKRLNELFTQYPKLRKLERIWTITDRFGRAAGNGAQLKLSTKAMFYEGGGEKAFLASTTEHKAYVDSRIKWLKDRLKKEVKGSDAYKTVKFRLNEAETEARFSRHTAYVKGQEVESTITHEFGHVIDDQLSGRINAPLRNKTLMSEAKMLEFEKEWQFIADNIGDDIYNISEYASTDAQELFAEAFEMYSLGEEANLPQEIIKYFEEYLGYMQ